MKNTLLAYLFMAPLFLQGQDFCSALNDIYNKTRLYKDSIKTYKYYLELSNDIGSLPYKQLAEEIKNQSNYQCVISALDSFINYLILDSISKENKRSLLSLRYDLILYKSLLSLDLESKLDTLISIRRFIDIKILIDSFPFQTIFNKVISTKNCDLIFSTFGDYIDSNSYNGRFVRNYVIDSFKNCYGMYFKTLEKVKNSSDLSDKELYNRELNSFFQNFDTSQTYIKYSYNTIILGQPTDDELARIRYHKEWTLQNEQREQERKNEELAIRTKWRYRQDSLINHLRTIMEIDDQLQEEINDLLNDPEYYKRGEDVITTEIPSYYTNEMRNLLFAGEDTTLWKGLKRDWMPSRNDDGKRFDIYTSAELMTSLDTFNIDSIYYGSISMYDNPMQVHIQKIVKILGDRAYYGSFVPSSFEKNNLMSLILKYEYIMCNDTNINIRYDVNDQLKRFSVLLFPYAIKWMHRDSNCLYGASSLRTYFRDFINKENLLLIIAEGDNLYSAQNDYKLQNISSFLNNFWHSVGESSSSQYSDRPERSIVELQSWVDDYIYPALKRWGYPGVK